MALPDVVVAKVMCFLAGKNCYKKKSMVFYLSIYLFVLVKILDHVQLLFQISGQIFTYVGLTWMQHCRFCVLGQRIF